MYTSIFILPPFNPSFICSTIHLSIHPSVCPLSIRSSIYPFSHLAILYLFFQSVHPYIRAHPGKKKTTDGFGFAQDYFFKIIVLSKVVKSLYSYIYRSNPSMHAFLISLIPMVSPVNEAIIYHPMLAYSLQ